MRRVAVAAVLACTITLLVSGGALMAQYQEQRGKAEITFDDAVRRVGGFSSRYFDGLSNRQRAGVFTLGPDDRDELARQLAELVTVLQAFAGPSELPPVQIESGQNVEALKAALYCEGCSGELSDYARAKPPLRNQAELQALLVARCGAVKSLIRPDKTGRVTRDDVFAIEVHLSYLRQIALAYIGTIAG